ncbi:hypothetical protein FB567DRAFT_521623 [Paraphoma chrysanthemicola]|uniref:Protein kinase domain-containing protein n=1 Tax=Paraphoma chrysanthemicola TaxID=798071 RepID=A0A8K0RAP9_9PLEO|nr:hypothetical protein FB567DRAFT_521623 [Paraphoma chrysanthemicola]
MRQIYARCEITILGNFKHVNIIQLYDSPIPEHGHGPPWMVTKYCDHRTVRDLLAYLPLAVKWSPSAFSGRFSNHWHRQPSTAIPVLRRAKCGTVCRIATLFRLLSLSKLTDQPKAPVSTHFPVKLGDFGCAVTDSD